MPELTYRTCDRCLWQQSLELMREGRAAIRSLRRTRRRAFVIMANMWLRDRLSLSRPPSPWLRLRVHGHHCGPGIGGPGAAPPIDDLDAHCQKHDKCYGEVARLRPPTH